MQPSVEGKIGGEQRRKRIFSGNFTEIFKCLVLEYLRRPLKRVKRQDKSAWEAFTWLLSEAWKNGQRSQSAIGYILAAPNFIAR